MARRYVHTCIRVLDPERSIHDLGDGYNRIALAVDDLDGMLAGLAEQGIEPEKPPFHPGGRPEVGRICFVQDPDGYRIEPIDGGGFRTPQDP